MKVNHRIGLSAAAAFAAVGLSMTAFAGDVCTFSDWAWHSELGKAVDYHTVRTTRDALSEDQIHPSLPCSVCEEDQTEITLSNGVSTRVCQVLAKDMEIALESSLEDGFPIQTLTGYRVGRTRGPLDGRGVRTKYSNHSLGIAIDINAGANGLYDRCVEWGPHCRLRIGGEWDPKNPTSISKGGPPQSHMDAVGFKWGGELAGHQKDFMHFSLTGN